MTSRAPTSLLDLLDASVRLHGPRPLFLTRRSDAWVPTTYTEFARLVDAVRGGLADLGVSPGDRIGIISSNCVEWAAVAYAGYGLRAAIVPMYESQRATDWAFVIRDAGLRVMFVSEAAVHARLADVAGALPTLHDVCVFHGPASRGGLTFEQLAGRTEAAPPARPSQEDVAAVMYTSGTTADPKGVVLTHGNLVSNITTVLSQVPVTKQHRSLAFLPWAHAFGQTLELHGVIAAGASMAIAESVDKIVDNLAEVRPTVLVAVPRVFLRVHARVTSMLAGKSRTIRWLATRGLALAKRRSTTGRRLPLHQHLLWWIADRVVFARVRQRVGGRLEFAISGAALLPKTVAELIDGLGIQLYEGYGLTEASPIVAANVPGHRKLGSVGRPLPGVRVVIDTTAGKDGREGEIVVYGPNVMRGYHGCPEATRSVLTDDGGLRTGDTGYLDEDGYLYITGRIKEQYKLANGKYVSPGPLEEKLKLSPLIADVMVHGEGQVHNVALVVPDLTTLCAALHAEAEELASPGAIERFLREPRVRDRIAAEIGAASSDFRGFERIEDFALLPEGFTLENGMLTPSLKLKRREVVARWGPQIEGLYASTAPGPAHAIR